MNMMSKSTHGVSREEYEALDNRITMIKAQNMLLTKEVKLKAERMNQLENEKASLIRELFDARTEHTQCGGHNDTTFM